MYEAFEGTVDSIGQWLTQLPVFGQTIVLLAFLVPVAGAVAFVFIGLIDIVVGRISGRWAKKRPTREGSARIELVEQDPS